MCIHHLFIEVRSHSHVYSYLGAESSISLILLFKITKDYCTHNNKWNLELVRASLNLSARAAKSSIYFYEMYYISIYIYMYMCIIYCQKCSQKRPEQSLQNMRGTILLTKTTAAQSVAALSYHRMRGLYFQAVVFVTTIFGQIYNMYNYI